MAILATAVSLWDGGELHMFEPGDLVPDWAEGRVGSHCLLPDAAASGLAGDSAVPVVRVGDAEPVADLAPDAAASGLDFTKPAPKRGPGRPRKGA
ncbi:hypothetical protein [Galactobacter caseinivorans]|uniref:Uncharacterized protein n=1 Tax=Galactobacter caseinivorans TaxID=2676123 RepID=A0A496PMI8_9MICC|nr:hypothetical protein [Galactobacter caseinivorans]RKW71752.1 hypothetical protein DWQ67_02690 [Galactobacter caseinivorans]